MDLTVINKSVRQLGHSIGRNSPTILTAIAVAGLFTTIALAIKATPKAMDMIEKEERFRYEEYGEEDDLDVVDTVKTVWKAYIPTVGMAVLTTGCIIGANHINLRRNAALASLFTIAEKTLREYQEKV